MQFYFDETREGEPYSLPDGEVFYADAGDLWDVDSGCYPSTDEPNDPGWYYWTCFPGCLPDSDPIGPFATEAEALADAREGIERG